MMAFLSRKRGTNETDPKEQASGEAGLNHAINNGQIQKRVDAANGTETNSSPTMGDILKDLAGDNTKAKGLLVQLLNHNAKSESVQKFVGLLIEKRITGDAILELHSKYAGTGTDIEKIDRMTAALELQD